MGPTSAAAILAGGDGRRLGGKDKALISLGGIRLIDRVHKSVSPQVRLCVVCLGSNKPWGETLNLPIIKDRPASDRGPLGGIAAALAWGVSLEPSIEWVVTAPVDVPFLPADLVSQLTMAGDGADIVVAKSGGQVHHTIAAWKPALISDLDEAIKDHAVPVHHFQTMVRTIEVEWAVAVFDPFHNINTPEDLALAEHYVASGLAGSTLIKDC